MEVSFSTKLKSFFYPVTLKIVSNDRHQRLSLQLYCNQFMLSTHDAVYSFGTFYTPFRKTFSLIKKEIAHCKSFLLLGTGLGSALKILQQKHHLYPDSVLVDNDNDILDLSINYMNLNSKNNVSWKYTDALNYLQTTTQTFDLIGVDVFRDTFIPKDYKQLYFFELCKKTLNTGGYCIFNMILNSSNEKLIIAERLRIVFSTVKEITFKMNTFYICSY